MTRSKSMTIAAVLLFVYNVYDAMQTIPLLAQGTATDGNMSKPPFAVSLLVFTLAIFGIVAAYGVWRNAKWGKVLGLVVTALNILYTLIPLLVAPLPIKLIAGGFIVLNILILWMLLQRESTSVAV